MLRCSMMVTSWRADDAVYFTVASAYYVTLRHAMARCCLFIDIVRQDDTPPRHSWQAVLR